MKRKPAIVERKRITIFSIMRPVLRRCHHKNYGYFFKHNVPTYRSSKKIYERIKWTNLWNSVSMAEKRCIATVCYWLNSKLALRLCPGNRKNKNCWTLIASMWIILCLRCLQLTKLFLSIKAFGYCHSICFMTNAEWWNKCINELPTTVNILIVVRNARHCKNVLMDVAENCSKENCPVKSNALTKNLVVRVVISSHQPNWSYFANIDQARCGIAISSLLRYVVDLSRL